MIQNVEKHIFGTVFLAKVEGIKGSHLGTVSLLGGN